MNLFYKLIRYLKIRMVYYFKLFILKLFYRNAYTEAHLKLSASLLFTIFIFQKIFGLNRHIKYPVHFTNTISQMNFEIDISSTISLAANSGIYIQAMNGVKIGKQCIIASGTKIVSANHELDNFEKHIENNPIIISNNCWIGANAVILPGVTLLEHVVVGAGAVVVKSFYRDSIIGGVPAKLIEKNI